MACPALTKEVIQTRGCFECGKGGQLAYHPGPVDFLEEMDSGTGRTSGGQIPGQGGEELQPEHGHNEWE